MYSAQIWQKIRKPNSKEKIKMGILVDSPKKNEYNVKQFDQDEVWIEKSEKAEKKRIWQ